MKKNKLLLWKSVPFLLLLLSTGLPMQAENCPGFAKKYKMTVSNSPINPNDIKTTMAGFFTIERLTSNQYVKTILQTGVQTLVTKECRNVSFSDAAEGTTDCGTFSGDIVCDGFIKPSMVVQGTCVLSFQHPCGGTIADAFSFKWRPIK